jgi:hypothetical protein
MKLRPEVIGALYDIFLLFLGGLIGVVMDRGIRWRKTRLKHETAILATQALDEASYVFNQSIAAGGRLAHPWDRYGKNIHCDDLQSRLRTSRSRIKDKSFRKNVDQIIADLQKVFAAAAVGRAAIAYSGMPSNSGDDAHKKATQAKADAQVQHARTGIEASELARIRLGDLETHT